MSTLVAGSKERYYQCLACRRLQTKCYLSEEIDFLLYTDIVEDATVFRLTEVANERCVANVNIQPDAFLASKVVLQDKRGSFPAICASPPGFLRMLKERGYILMTSQLLVALVRPSTASGRCIYPVLSMIATARVNADTGELLNNVYLEQTPVHERVHFHLGEADAR